MSQFIMYLELAVVCLSPGPGSVIIQEQTTDIKLLDRDNGQYPSVEERERARNEIRRITDSIIAATVILRT